MEQQFKVVVFKLILREFHPRNLNALEIPHAHSRNTSLS